MLCIVSSSQRLQSVVLASRCDNVSIPWYKPDEELTPTGMHCPKHACDEFIDPIAFLHQWYQRGYPAFVVRTTPEV